MIGRGQHIEVKRLFMPDAIQRTLALLGFVLTLPLLVALAVAVRAESHGSAIYSAKRVGEGGRPFTCLKIRSMVARQAPEQRLTRASDPRVTRIGRMLRRTHLDELPQLWNIARGEMRFVGPRPEDPHFVDFDLPMHRLVFRARPGITGLAQLLNADEETRLVDADPERTYRDVLLPRKLELDAAYLRHRSTRLDLWILAQTPRAVLGREIRLPAPLRGEVANAAGAEL
jgi:lipopolysaccharide/colanic/teichoic acid biosynthesis glycosyltransferase